MHPQTHTDRLQRIRTALSPFLLYTLWCQIRTALSPSLGTHLKAIMSFESLLHVLWTQQLFITILLLRNLFHVVGSSTPPPSPDPAWQELRSRWIWLGSIVLLCGLVTLGELVLKMASSPPLLKALPWTRRGTAALWRVLPWTTGGKAALWSVLLVMPFAVYQERERERDRRWEEYYAAVAGSPEETLLLQPGRVVESQVR